MQSTRTLKTAELHLRSIEPDDSISEYFAWLREPETTKFLEIRANPPESEDALWDFIQAEKISEGSLLFGIFLAENGRLIGTVRLSSVSQVHKRAEIGILVGVKDLRRKGVASAAINQVVQYAFKDLSLRNIHAGFYSGHHASRSLFAKLGFKSVAVIPNYFRLDDGSYQAREIVCLGHGDL